MKWKERVFKIALISFLLFPSIAGGTDITWPTGSTLTFGTTQWDDGSDKFDGEVCSDDSVDDDAIDFSSDNSGDTVSITDMLSSGPGSGEDEIKLCGVSLLVMASFIFVNTCFAVSAIEVLRPTSDVDVNIANTSDGGGVHYTEVDDQLSDAGATVVYTDAGATHTVEYDLYGIQNHSAASVGTIEKVSLVALTSYECLYSPPACFGKIYFKLTTHSTTYTASPQNITSGWASYTEDYATNPYTSSAWTWDEVNDLIAGFGFDTQIYTSGACSLFYVKVTYTLPTGETLRPTSDSDVNLDSTAGDNYTEVDEDPINLADYVSESGVAGYTKDLYGMGDSGVGTGTINSVTVVWSGYGYKPWFNPGGGNIKPTVKMGGTEYDGSEKELSFDWASGDLYSQTWNENPNTSSAWTWANIDDLIAGIQIKSYDAASVTAVTQFYVIVDYTVEGGASLSADIDALIKKALSDGVDLDAYLTKSIPITLDLDALLNLVGQTKTLEIDALLQKAGVDTSLSLDAILQQLKSGEISLDALLNQVGLTTSSSLDAILEQSGIVQVFLDALLNKTGLTASSSLDAILQQLKSGQVSIDALLNEVGQTDQASLDALLNALGVSSTAELDALLNKIGLTISSSIDALLNKVGQASQLNIDALLNAIGLTSTADLDALLSETGLTITSDLDAILAAIYTKTISLDALLNKMGIEASLSIDALLNKTGLFSTTELDAFLTQFKSGQLSLDALLAKYGVLFQLNLDALLVKAQSASTELDAHLIMVVTESLYLDSLLTKGITGHTELDALLNKLGSTSSVLLDGYLTKLGQISVTLDSILQKQGITVSGLDALVQGEIQKPISLDAFLFVGKTKDVSIDSLITQTLGKEVNIEAILQGQYGEITLLDALIYATLLNAIPRFALYSTLEQPACKGSPDLAFKSNLEMPELRSKLEKYQFFTNI